MAWDLTDTYAITLATPLPPTIITTIARARSALSRRRRADRSGLLCLARVAERVMSTKSAAIRQAAAAGEPWCVYSMEKRMVELWFRHQGLVALDLDAVYSVTRTSP